MKLGLFERREIRSRARLSINLFTEIIVKLRGDGCKLALKIRTEKKKRNKPFDLLPMTSSLFTPVVCGKKSAPSKGTIVFLAGFPDDQSSFNKVAPAFEDTHTVVKLCMPDYDKRKLGRFLGYPFYEILESLHALLSLYKQKNGELTLVGHDWGSFICQLYVHRFPETVDRLVLLDVGYINPKRATLHTLVVFLSYQTWLCFSFLLGRLTFTILGDIMMGIYPWRLIGPCPHEDELGVPLNRLAETKSWWGRFLKGRHCWFGYPYFRSHYMRWSEKYPLKTSMPTCPVLFVYGTRKRILFHTSDFLSKLEKKGDGSAHLALDCGHWIQFQKPNELIEKMKEFL